MYYTINTSRRLYASKEFGLGVKASKTKYMVMSWDQNTARHHGIKIDNSPFERVEVFKYFGKIVTNQNCIQKEIKNRLMSGNVCYHWVKNLRSSIFLEGIKNKVQRIIIFHVVFYGWETWWLILKEEGKLRPLESRVLRRIFGPKSDEETWEWRKLINEQVTELFSSPDVIRLVKSRIMTWAAHVVRMGERKAACGILVGKPEGQIETNCKTQA